MAKERKASVIYEGNASQLVYAFPFDYLRKKFVKVEDIYTSITELTIGVDYTVEDKQVRLVKGIPLGHSVKIYRETTTAPLVEWQDASVLRSADLSLQEVQLLHLAEETADKVFDSGMSTAYDNPNCWDGQYKRIINALDPIEDGDVVTLRYIKVNQDSLLNQLKNTGATQNKRIIDTGNAYVSTMTTLKDTATTKANDASNSAELSKRWAMSSSSPDGVTGNKSSKTWAEEAKTSASVSSSSASASASSATNSANSAKAAKQSETASANSASASASSASAASTSASNAKISETNASNSAKAAKQSEENAKTWDPTQYVQSVTESNGKLTVTKGSGDSTIINLVDIFYPIGSVYMSADKTKTKSDFPILQYGTWEEVPANLCLQTGNASEAGTQREAGLPNITGSFNLMGVQDTESNSYSGAIYRFGSVQSWGEGHTPGGQPTVALDASRSSSIYGASDTVQPPAYMVRAWIRTA